MTIIENSVVVATDEVFSFVVPETDMAAALALTVIPPGLLPHDSNILVPGGKGRAQVDASGKLETFCSLDGLVVSEPRITHRMTEMYEGIPTPCVRIMFNHASNPKSIIRSAQSRPLPGSGRKARIAAAREKAKQEEAAIQAKKAESGK